MPKSVTGVTYGAIASAIADAARKINGTVEVPGSNGVARLYAKLSNAHALAIFQAMRHGGARSAGTAITVNEWSWQLAWAALGWKNWGDKFIMSKEHAAKPYPTALLGVFWDQVHDSAAALDAAKTVVRALPLDYSYAAYEQAARDAWEAMRRLDQTRPPAVEPLETSAAPSIIKPIPTPVPVPVPTPILPGKRNSSGMGLVVLLLLTMLVGSRRR
jgi:hypothetical protein